MNSIAQRAYQARSYAGLVVLFKADAGASDDPTNGWAAGARDGVDVIPIPARHEDFLFEPHVRIVAERLRESIARHSSMSALSSFASVSAEAGAQI